MTDDGGWRALASTPTSHGRRLELPLAAPLDADAALLHLTARKDIEGLSPANLALIAAGREGEALLPPTPRSIRFLLREALGESFCQAYERLRRRQWDSFREEISELGGGISAWELRTGLDG